MITLYIISIIISIFGVNKYIKCGGWFDEEPNGITLFYTFCFLVVVVSTLFLILKYLP